MYRIIFIISLMLSASVMQAQESKKPLGHDVYPGWKTIKNVIISPDGRWVSYEINPLKGDGILYLVNPGNGFRDSLPRAYDAVFSPGSDYLAFKIKQPADTIRKLKLDKKKDEDLPKDSLGIWVFKNNLIFRDGYVKSFVVPKDSGSFMAYLLEEKKEIKVAPPKKDSLNAEPDSLKPEKKEDEKPAPKKEKKKGCTLVIANPLLGQADTCRFVSEYVFSSNGNILSYAITRKDSLDSLMIVNYHTSKRIYDTVFYEAGTGKKLTSSKYATGMAFLYSPDTSKIKTYRLVYYDIAKKKSGIACDTLQPELYPAWCASENSVLKFSDDGSLLYFGIAPRPKDEPKDTLLEDEKVKVDVWNWNDGRLQSQQINDLKDDKKKTLAAVYHTQTQRLVQLADSTTDQTRYLKDNLNLALNVSEQPYLKLQSWEWPAYRDIYLVNVNNGEKKMLLEKNQYSYSFSPFGKYLLYYTPADSTWNVYSVETQSSSCLSCGTQVAFYDEKHDAPMEPEPYGIAGWAENDAYVYIYNRYDIWKFDPAMKEKPVNITVNGRLNKQQYRYIKTDYELQYIPASEVMLLGMFDETTKQEGFFSLKPDGKSFPKTLLVQDKMLMFSVKARKAAELVFTAQDFQTYPDLLYTRKDFKKISRISNANPQQKDYLWGTVSLISWQMDSENVNQGLLYKPENFDPSKKYPVIIYFYERYSDQLHQHWIPSPSRSIINPAIYSSNGYIVFIPDIWYREGQPGPSASKTVISAGKYLKTLPYVDGEHIGIQGQSWGGYQVAYIVTQTDMFAAAMAGAAVSNMVSAYGGIRWESGMSRMFQYEESQSRLGKTLWEDTERYITNSPIFYADKINTPLLMMNNDNDGAVPWYQGIELFTALRRLEKPAWMLVYNGDEHNLMKWPNRIDLSIRMMQFFDHYLKGSPEPDWMSKGVPAISKGKVTGY